MCWLGRLSLSISSLWGFLAFLVPHLFAAPFHLFKKLFLSKIHSFKKEPRKLQVNPAVGRRARSARPAPSREVPTNERIDSLSASANAANVTPGPVSVGRWARWLCLRARLPPAGYPPMKEYRFAFCVSKHNARPRCVGRSPGGSLPRATHSSTPSQPARVDR